MTDKEAEFWKDVYVVVLADRVIKASLDNAINEAFYASNNAVQQLRTKVRA